MNEFNERNFLASNFLRAELDAQIGGREQFERAFEILEYIILPLLHEKGVEVTPEIASRLLVSTEEIEKRSLCFNVSSKEEVSISRYDGNPEYFLIVKYQSPESQIEIKYCTLGINISLYDQEKGFIEGYSDFRKSSEVQCWQYSKEYYDKVIEENPGQEFLVAKKGNNAETYTTSIAGFYSETSKRLEAKSY